MDDLLALGVLQLITRWSVYRLLCVVSHFWLLFFSREKYDLVRLADSVRIVRFVRNVRTGGVRGRSPCKGRLCRPPDQAPDKIRGATPRKRKTQRVLLH